MAHSKQAKKRVRQSEARFAVNKARKSRVRTYLRRVEEAVDAGGGHSARDALRAAESEMMRAVSKGVFNRNQARRKISRLAKRVRLAS
ncbi:MAG: 30S ribosomal protein S20 [Rhodobacteraceae bacterium]|nr:30S ribosomal protein S20 [Paracoccaceae bacterium]